MRAETLGNHDILFSSSPLLRFLSSRFESFMISERLRSHCAQLDLRFHLKCDHLAISLLISISSVRTSTPTGAEGSGSSAFGSRPSTRQYVGKMIPPTL